MGRSGKSVMILGAALTALCVLPHAGVVLAALSGNLETLTALWNTVLWRFTWTTLTLVAIVCTGTFVVGTTCAWLVTATEFRGRRVFEVVLVLPLAMPAYVLAYAYTDVLDHPGIVQTVLRNVMGWGPRDYWFPEIRSLGGAAAMLTFVLYPYVYLLARAAFFGQSAAPFLAARALGRSQFGAFWSVSLPMARPAIAGGVLLAAMETIADFGTVSFFSVQTFATGIYQSWISFADRPAAAQLSLGLLTFALILAVLERSSRGRAQFSGSTRREPMPRVVLQGRTALVAQIVCLAPVLLGLVIPVIALGFMAVGSEQNLLSPRYLGFIQNSLTLSSIAAVLTVGGAVVLGSLARFHPGRSTSAALYMGRIGYAVPGGVIAVGLLVPAAAFDNALDAVMEARFGIDTGLLITGSIWALVGAYMIRFMAAALGAYEGGIATVSPNMDAAARVLGQGPWGLLARVHIPAMTPSMLTALLIVFVDVMKELPATLVMRPFNWDTLAVQAYRLASDERLEGAAVPSLVLAGIGLLPVLLLCRQMAKTSATPRRAMRGDPRSPAVVQS